MATGYSLTTHYAGQGLLDSFSFFTGNDPSNGFVDYQSREDALAMNLVSVGSDYNNVRLGVDSNNTYSASDKGRPSVRLTSQDAFNHGLFIADIYHMPASTCGTWPAFWAFNNQDNGSDWPVGGELEIIEGANTAQRNLFSAHTTEGCQATSNGFSGEQGLTDCSPGPENLGCNYASPTSDTTSYGSGFNAEEGGVYAMQWDSEDLKLWHFPRSTIPDNIVYAHVVGPDPTTWGPPQAIFGGSSCNPDTYFFNLSLVLNINFCGDYAGNIWGKADQCNRLAPTCEQFVANNPDSFQESYWDINFIDVYQIAPLTNETIPPLFANGTLFNGSSVATSTTTTDSTTTPSAIAPTHTRTITLSSVVPTQTNAALGTRDTPSSYTLLGCYGSSAGYSSFSKARSSLNMDPETCLDSCVGHRFAGVYDNMCYCADNLGDAKSVGSDMCTTPCPGDDDRFCGGVADPNEMPTPFHSALNSTLPANVTLTALHNRRDDPSVKLLTVYGDMTNEPAPFGAPAMGGPSIPEPPTKSHTVTTAITVTYKTICPTNPASLVETKYATTVTYEDCDCTKHQPAHPTIAHHPANSTGTPTTTFPVWTAVPMTTYPETCHACGPHGESTVTLTVPVAVVTQPAVVTAIAVHTVIPVISNATTANQTTFTPSTPRPSSNSNSFPSPIAGSAGSKTATVAETIGWGLAVWFLLFGAMLAI